MVDESQRKTRYIIDRAGARTRNGYGEEREARRRKKEKGRGKRELEGEKMEENKIMKKRCYRGNARFLRFLNLSKTPIEILLQDYRFGFLHKI